LPFHFENGEAKEMRKLFPFVFLLVACSGAPALEVGTMAPAPPHLAVQQQHGGGSPIKHIVIIFQENRSFDNLFHGFPGADSVSTGTDSSGSTIALQPVNLWAPYDVDHSHDAFLTEYDKGAMNGFNLASALSPSGGPTPPPDIAYSYVPQSQVQPYWTMAQQYALADRMFQTNSGPSFPAHAYIISGTAATNSTNTIDILSNPSSSGYRVGGCDSSSTTTVKLINPLTNAKPTPVFPCFDHPVLMDLLDNAHVSWRYYQPWTGAGLWNGPDAISHVRYGADYANVITPNTAILSDISNGRLPGVSWVMPTLKESDHGSVTDGSGPAWVAQVVNAIGQSGYWRNTAIFITWDDWGGWYDHVAPQQFNYVELGFRVPLIVVSPYARRGYVSHTQHEFGSILRFTEEAFGLPSLGYTDARADDLSDMFNFGQYPLKFRTIPAPAVSSADMRATGNPDSDF
jgi:phospholipase C